MSVFDVKGFENMYLFEKDRRESFKSWPFNEQSACSINKMAEAGFIWSGNEKENDTATCFTCGKVLDGWEANDDPWVEHKKHAPQCHFLKLGKPESNITIDEFIDLFGIISIDKIRKTHKTIRRKMEKNFEIQRDKFIQSFQK